MAQAMAEDPTVYEYDEVYDKIEEDRKKTMVAKLGQGKNKPKYITSLKKAADQRQREYERVIERKVCLWTTFDLVLFKDLTPCVNRPSLHVGPSLLDVIVLNYLLQHFTVILGLKKNLFF